MPASLGSESTRYNITTKNVQEVIGANDFPQGEMEEKLADILRELLNVDRISRHDNFFALGGDSLLILRLLAQLRAIGLDSTVQEVFDAPSLAMLASTFTHYRAITVPPNPITEKSTEITPEMLPLITLSQADIDKIITQVPGGVANIQDIYGLTPLQNGMLFHHLMAKEGDPYLVVNQMKFIDRTSLECYADALQQVMKRHDILRTAFIWEELSEPAQVVWRQVPSFLTEITLDGNGKSDLDQLSNNFDPRHYRLNLAHAPLLRLLVAPAPKGSWVALQLMHHLIIDNSTLDRLQTEVRVISEKQSEKLSIAIPFRQVVSQARLRVNPDELNRFFSEMLSDIDEPTLAFGLNKVGWDGDEINESNLKMSHVLSDQLRMHARNSHVSLASICHLAWAQVLSKASGREAVVFGTVLLGRLQDVEGNDSAVGPMINTLPLRLDIDERSVFTAVRLTHARLSALLAHEHAPLVLAQRCSSVPASLPIFNALLNYRHSQKTRQDAASFSGVSFLKSVGWTNYSLTMFLDDNDESLYLTTQVLSTISATRICAYMQQALKSLADALAHTPQNPMRELAIMPREERTLLLHGWNQVTVTHSPVCCLHQLFEAQVEIDGKAIAVNYEGQTLSFAELNTQANQLAQYLISKGVKPDHTIALCVERSTTMIVAMLGILKSGCAYVPLDPVYTSQRLTNILHDADPIFVLADATGRRALRDHQVPVIELEKSLPTDLPMDNSNASKLSLTTAHLAYVIYTSGSTGTPKGVMVEHQQIVRLFGATHDKFELNKQDKWCLFQSISFDISVWEIWGALLYGSQLSVVPHKIIYATDVFYNWICAHCITVLNQTSSAFKMLMRAENVSCRSDRLRYIIFVGEELDPMIAKEWFKKCHKSGTILNNMYGPTETTVYAMFQRIEITEDIYSIGRSLPDLCVYLLDSHGEPVPLGSEGEMYISGPGVARGYLNRAELTAERFLFDPFSKSRTARMYRTGDRARYLSDGNLVFLGRMDQQVKIRGFRIELGEIEARLVEHPQVRETVVQPYHCASDTRLVAYVVAEADKSLILNLRDHLSTLLPDYMVPAAYVFLSSLPLTVSGKLDRRALPAPNDEAFVRQQYEAPQGEMEEKLSDIWCELLNVQRISRYDNFFELGGHSLLVMHFVNKAKLCDMHIDARGVFTFPILKNLADQITSGSKRFHCNVAIPARLYGTEDPLFLTPDGTGNISYAFELAKDIDKNIPVYVLPWPSPENNQPSSIEEMANAMIPLIKNVRTNGPCAIAGYSAGGILAFEITKQLRSSGYPVSFLGLVDTPAPIPAINSETEIFLTTLRREVPVFKTFGDSFWWDRVCKLTLNEVVNEIHNTGLDLSNTDIEWELLLSKQRHNYQKICGAFKIDSQAIKIHLFKAVDLGYQLDASDECLINLYKKINDYLKKSFNYPKLGWENYNHSVDFHIISVDGDHQTMITDPRNRFLLGKELTKSLQPGNH